jgi:hypothetical protein
MEQNCGGLFLSPYVEIDYTNWRGHRKTYLIRPIGVRLGTTPWHTEAHYLLNAEVIKKGEIALYREFAMKDIHSWAPKA